MRRGSSLPAAPYGEVVHIEGDYDRDGAVCVRNAVSGDLLALAESAIEATLRDLSPLALRASGEDDGAFVEDFCNWARIPDMGALVHDPGLAEIAAGLMGSDTVRLYHDHVLVKEAGTRQPTPWHQDQPYYNVDGDQTLSMWLPVDPVPRAATLEIVAGSHRGPWYLPRTFFDQEAKWFPEGTLAEPPDFDADSALSILGWDLAPGDAVFFNMGSVHRTAGSDRLRRVVTVRYLGDDVTFAPRRWATSPPFTGLEEALAPGSPMNHERFPMLWPCRA